MKNIIQVIVIFLFVSFITGCGEQEEHCQNSEQKQCKQQDKSAYDALKEPVDRSKSKEF